MGERSGAVFSWVLASAESLPLCADYPGVVGFGYMDDQGDLGDLGDVSPMVVWAIAVTQATRATMVTSAAWAAVAHRRTGRRG